MNTLTLERYMNNAETFKQITRDEVIKIFKDEFEVDMNDYARDEIQYISFENNNYKVRSEVDEYGGEGQGEERWNVSKVIDKRTNEVFFLQFSGFYNSWEGTDWSENDWSIVKPTIVEVIQWH